MVLEPVDGGRCTVPAGQLIKVLSCPMTAMVLLAPNIWKEVELPNPQRPILPGAWRLEAVTW